MRSYECLALKEGRIVRENVCPSNSLQMCRRGTKAGTATPRVRCAASYRQAFL
jgi:hypothetical protein